MKVKAPHFRPWEPKNQKGLDRNPYDRWGDTRITWVRNENSYHSPAKAPENLLAFLTPNIYIGARKPGIDTVGPIRRPRGGVNGSLSKFSAREWAYVTNNTPKLIHARKQKLQAYFQDQVVTTDLLTLGTSQEKPRSKAEENSKGNEKTKALKPTFSRIVGTTGLASVLLKKCSCSLKVHYRYYRLRVGTTGKPFIGTTGSGSILLAAPRK